MKENTQRESIVFDIDMENLSNYNLKKSFSISKNDFLMIEDLNIDEKIFHIEKKFDNLKKNCK